MSHEGVIARTIMLDRQLNGIIKKAPDTVVVNVGAGFDDRFSRMDNGRILWFDLDLPDAIGCVSESAERYNLSKKETFNYLYKYKVIEFLKENYEIEHTLSLDDALDDLFIIYRNNGCTL